MREVYKTIKNSNDHLLAQEVNVCLSPNKITFSSKFTSNPHDFTRLSVEKISNFLVNFTVERYKSGRLYSKTISLDKTQMEFLIDDLILFKNTLK